MTQDKELDRSRELARLNTAYQRTFGTEDGKTVLQNLRAYFRMARPAFERSLHHPYDPREVILFIEHKLSQPVIADGDIEQPKTTVTRA